MMVLGCGKQVLGVRAAKTTIGIKTLKQEERFWEFGVMIFLFDLIHGSNKSEDKKRGILVNQVAS